MLTALVPMVILCVMSLLACPVVFSGRDRRCRLSEQRGALGVAQSDLRSQVGYLGCREVGQSGRACPFELPPKVGRADLPQVHLFVSKVAWVARDGDDRTRNVLPR